MNILILSRKKTYYSTKRLAEEAKKLHHHPTVLDPLTYPLHIAIPYPASRIPHPDVVIPRIGTIGLEYSLLLLRQFQLQGVKVVNSPEAIGLVKNKFHCLQVLAKHHLPVPPTVMVRENTNIEKVIKQLDGFPVIIKLLKGSQGTGVMLGVNMSIVKSILKTAWALNYDALIQKYVHTTGLKNHNDIRALVVGGRIIAAIRRYAKGSEFRSNIHCGAKAENVSLPRSYTPVILKTVRATGLDIAGVDIIETDDGPVILEVNASPGFEGLEKVTCLNIAHTIIRFAIQG